MSDENDRLFRAAKRTQWFASSGGDLSLATRVGLDMYVNSTGLIGISPVLVGRLIEELDEQNLGL